MQRLFSSPVHIAAILACVAVLGGCAAATPFGAVEAVSVMASDKTLTDHAISVASGKDCSILRKEQGKTYCVEDQVNPVYPQNYCYKTIGKVTCYDRPDPRYQRVDRDNKPGKK